MPHLEALHLLRWVAGTLPNAEVAVGVTGLTLQFSTFVWITAASFASATSFTVANKVGGWGLVGCQCCPACRQGAGNLRGCRKRPPLLTLPPCISLSLRHMPARSLGRGTL